MCHLGTGQIAWLFFVSGSILLPFISVTTKLFTTICVLVQFKTISWMRRIPHSIKINHNKHKSITRFSSFQHLEGIWVNKRYHLLALALATSDLPGLTGKRPCCNCLIKQRGQYYMFRYQMMQVVADWGDKTYLDVHIGTPTRGTWHPFRIWMQCCILRVWLPSTMPVWDVHF